MAFQLSSRATLAGNLGSIFANEIDSLTTRSAADVDERVHETRKTIKRLRALLRLFRAALNERDYLDADELLRNTGRSLGGFRDAAVMRLTLETLLQAAPADDRARLSQHQEELARALGASDGAQDTEAEVALGAAHELLGTVRDRMASAHVEDGGFQLIAPGFRRVYRNGRRALRRAARRANESRLHTLRKLAKRHQYHLTLLEPLWPGPIHAVRREVSTLGDLLGLDHDLSVLEHRFEALTMARDPSISSALRASTEARHEDLRRRALDLAARIYAESPSRLVARHREYFDAWQCR